MAATVIIGGQWGDEGKAKVVDYLMANFDVVVRFQGGANAGHTVVADGKKYVFHLVPSGLLYPHVTGMLGNGMVVDPFEFINEVHEIAKQGIDVEGRLFISSGAQVVLEHHRVLDNLYETDLKKEAIGSTGKGIGPTYACKANRTGMRMGDFLLDKDKLFEFVSSRVDFGNRLLEVFGAPPFSSKKIASDMANLKDLISHFIIDAGEAFIKMKEEGKRILLEGAQGALLDIDHGTYPFVTSSSCSVGGALTGTGLNLKDIDRVIGIFKAYTTRVGNGPFPTELEGMVGEKLRAKGAEFGTTTGRPRRCGWFDLIAAKHSIHINGFDEIALMKLDVLSGLKEIKVCVAYSVDGKEIKHFPQSIHILNKCEPVYETVPGWSDEELKTGSFEELPENARRYIEMLEARLGVRMSFISTGASREKTIIRDGALSLDA